MDVKILVVDDEKSIRNWVLKMLSKYGYEIDAAKDYKSAVEMMAKSQYDVIVTDKNMPDDNGELESGLRLLKHAKEVAPESEVIIMTGFATVDTAVEAMKSGAFDYITKPFKIEDLNEKIARILEYRSFINSRLNLQIYKNLHAELLGLLQNETDQSEEELHHLLKSLGRRIDHLFGSQKDYEAVVRVQKEALENIETYAQKLKETTSETGLSIDLIQQILYEAGKRIT